MLPKTLTSAAVSVVSLIFVALVSHADGQAKPAAPAAPPAPVAPPPVASPGTQNRILGEAEAAFAAKDYATAASKLKELLAALGPKKDPTYEGLYFHLGLANLLGEKYPEAETAFADCAKFFPNGEYTSRCFLGIGRACILQDTPDKKQQAIEVLKKAAMDPKYRSEAGLWLGQALIDLGKHDEALAVFRSLMGADVRTPQQTTAAVEVIGLLADAGKIEDLIAYLDRLSHQAGIRDAIAWYVNQVIVRGDELVGTRAYEAALTIYRSVPPRSQIVEIQNLALEAMRKDQTALEKTIAAEKDKPVNKRSNASELLTSLKPGIELAETATKAIEEKADLDAALLMRRGRCLYYLDRYEEALLCFRTIRTKYKSSPDAEHASYAEIVILNKLKNIPEIKEKCEQFMRKYPESTNIEQVATLAGEVLVQGGDWKEVGAFYRGLEQQFPKSESMERYVFYQAVALFMEANFKESSPIFTRFLKDYPKSDWVETAMYYMAMSNFLGNKYKETLASCKEYLAKFPDGRYAGDMHYRLSFIDFNDKEVDQSDKIIRELGEFLQTHPKDAANGSMWCLIADTYKKKKVNPKADPATQAKEIQANEDAALDAYKKAVQTDSLDDIMQYALDSATAIMQRRKEWKAIADMHADFMQRRPNSQLFLLSASWIARMYAREGQSEKAAEVLANAMGPRIGDPASEQVEFLIDELVKTLVPKKKAKDIDVEAIEKKLVEVLTKVIGDKQNTTTAARIYYARARLAQLLKDTKRSDLYLKGIATTNAEDPSGLSPALLSVCGDILLKNGDVAGAEVMFKRLADRYRDSMFSDAGPVGLGFVALARKQFEEALKIFEDALENNNGIARFKEANLGKLQALTELDRFEPAEKLALSIVSDKSFRGETAAKAYMLLARIYRKQSAKATGADSKELLKKAYGTYQRVYSAYRAVPEVCAEAYWQAYEVAKELGDLDIANENLKKLSLDPKLQNTQRAKDALKQVK
jgi:tetratricopeptide (TPR) repeat protein